MAITYIVNGERVDPDGKLVTESAKAEAKQEAPFDPATVEDGDLDNLRKAQLLVVAEHRDIPADERMTRDDIIAALKAANASNSDED